MNIDSVPMSDLLERDEKGNFTGRLSAPWMAFFQNNILQMQQCLSNNGFLLPRLDTATINDTKTLNTVGFMAYDEETNEYKVNVNVAGTPTIKVIQLA